MHGVQLAGTENRVDCFTHRGVAALKAGDKRYIVWKPAAHGGQGNLGLRVFPTGNKTWVFMYRHEGKARMMRLGSFPAMSVQDAHAAEAKAALDHQMGLDPAAPAVEQRRKDRRGMTVGELAEKYLELYARPRKRSADRDEALLRRNVLCDWDSRKVSSQRRWGHPILPRNKSSGRQISGTRTATGGDGA